jgi:energy-coupling factor transporter transmembrane protein EcfT
MAWSAAPDFSMLVAIFLATSALAAFVPKRWGWKAFPLVLMLLAIGVLAAAFGPWLFSSDTFKGVAIHVYSIHLLAATLGFAIMFGIRQLIAKAR